MHLPLQLQGSVNTNHSQGDNVMKPKTLIYGLVILAAVIAWAAFRPERLFVNAKANEGFPTSAASTATERILAAGTFHSVAHDGSGNASIYELSDGKRILRFTNFKTSNGPDVHAYLCAADDATEREMERKAGYGEDATAKR